MRRRCLGWLEGDSAILRAEVTLKLGELAFKEDRKDRAIELWESALRSLGGKLPSAWMLPLSTVREIAVRLCTHFCLACLSAGSRQNRPPMIA